jgi:hypothetical protein
MEPMERRNNFAAMTRNVVQSSAHHAWNAS